MVIETLSPSFCSLYIYKKWHFPLCAAVFSSLLILSLHPPLPARSDVHLTRIIENDSCNWLVTSSTELLLHCVGSLFLEETELSNKRHKVSYGVKLDIPMAGPHFQKVLLILPASGHYTAPISPEFRRFWICIHGGGAAKLQQIIEVIGKPQGHLDCSPAYFRLAHHHSNWQWVVTGPFAVYYDKRC